jgi:hypothetical protein
LLINQPPMRCDCATSSLLCDVTVLHLEATVGAITPQSSEGRIVFPLSLDIAARGTVQKASRVHAIPSLAGAHTHSLQVVCVRVRRECLPLSALRPHWRSKLASPVSCTRPGEVGQPTRQTVDKRGAPDAVHEGLDAVRPPFRRGGRDRRASRGERHLVGRMPWSGPRSAESGPG